ncbi:nucleoside hydrolase [Inquilinus sp. CAU 1745]|uniref:nucleoside hydrolase n=1 Tax=Inquilinus sp. CAU 1745 TaxID=3140369 RepID=UPI00325B77CB
MASDPRPIIIDTDPGQDDAVAILLAFASPELKVLGLTTVAGNVPLPLTTLNALKIRELGGRPEVPVRAGCARPMLRPLVTAEHVHGRTGLDGADLPDPALGLADGHAVDWMVDTLMAAGDGEITLCPLGPLTNIAAAIVKEPRIVPKIREIVLMGGGYFEAGNITPMAEFNIYVDPHAASIVLDSGAPATILPLDVTHKALISRAWLDGLRTAGTPVTVAVAGLVDYFERFDTEKYGGEGGPLHDPCVIAYLLHPEWFEGRECGVKVETQSELTMGATVVDWWRVTDWPKNARFITALDRPRYFDLLAERLATL